jgi:serralysin
MPNLFPPKVTVHDSVVELGKKISLASMFSVSDLDPNTTITKYRFRDNSGVAITGSFEINGVVQPANVWFEINAADLSKIFYRAGLVISSESISVEAFDGQFWSQTAVGNVFSVVPNVRVPIITAGNTSVLSSESLVINQLVSAVDPDGYPIQKYLFVDRSFGPGSGFFLLNGVLQPSATWFQVNAADLPFLRYIGGQNAGFENIGIQAFDGAQWSAIVDVTWTTTPNNFAPVVQAFDLTIPVNRVVSIDELFQFSDLDGNTLKKVQFFDTGVLPTGGYFTVDGVVQAANVWFEVTRDQLGTVQYHTASTFDFERFRVRAFDGKYWSTNVSAKIVSVTPPDFDIPRVIRLNALEELLASTVITPLPGPPITQYEIIDLSPGSTTAKILAGGSILPTGVVRSLTPAQFAAMQFVGGQEDRGREFDDFAFRGFNGVFWSEWTHLNVHTDAYADTALDSGSDWATPPGTTILTYTLLNAIPGYYATNSEEYVGGPIPLSGLQRAVIRETLDMYETFLNVDFVEVPQTPGNPIGDITFGLTGLPDDVLGWAYLPSGPGIPGDIWLNKIFDDILNMTEEGRLTVVHELGHALGLTHPFMEDPTDFNNLPAPVENQRYTVMSYTRPEVPERAETIMLYDALELQKDYGANFNFNSGDTTITLPDNFIKFRLIWDGGGIDTLDLSNQTNSLVVDLREGRLSSVGGIADNLGVAYGAIIENSRGGIGDDELFGNEIDNTLIGNGGADRITGFSGNDVARGGAGNDRYFYTLGHGFDTINEEALGGRETLTIGGFGAFDSFTQDLSFRVINGRDLDIQLTIDGGTTQGGILIKDMAWGGSRIETLRLTGASGASIGPNIDLRSIFVYSTSELQTFQTTEFTSQFGTLCIPV